MQHCHLDAPLDRSLRPYFLQFITTKPPMTFRKTGDGYISNNGQIRIIAWDHSPCWMIYRSGYLMGSRPTLADARRFAQSL